MKRIFSFLISLCSLAAMGQRPSDARDSANEVVKKIFRQIEQDSHKQLYPDISIELKTPLGEIGKDLRSLEFTWTTTGGDGKNSGLKYQISIAPLSEGQTLEQVMQSPLVKIIAKDLNESRFVYSSLTNINMKGVNAWQVNALNPNGKVVARSAVGAFAPTPPPFGFCYGLLNSSTPLQLCKPLTGSVNLGIAWVFWGICSGSPTFNVTSIPAIAGLSYSGGSVTIPNITPPGAYTITVSCSRGSCHCNVSRQVFIYPSLTLTLGNPNPICRTGAFNSVTLGGADPSLIQSITWYYGSSSQGINIMPGTGLTENNNGIESLEQCPLVGPPYITSINYAPLVMFNPPLGYSPCPLQYITETVICPTVAPTISLANVCVPCPWPTSGIYNDPAPISIIGGIYSSPLTWSVSSTGSGTGTVTSAGSQYYLNVTAPGIYTINVTVQNCYLGNCCPAASSSLTVTVESACCTINVATPGPLCPRQDDVLSLNCIPLLSPSQTIQWKYLVDQLSCPPSTSPLWTSATVVGAGTSQNTNAMNYFGATRNMCWTAVISGIVCPPKTLSPITLNITQLPCTPVTTVGSQVLCPGGTTTLTALSSVISPCGPVTTYILYKDGVPFATSPTGIFTMVGPGEYYVRASNGCGLSGWSVPILIINCNPTIIWTGACCWHPHLPPITAQLTIDCGIPLNVTWTVTGAITLGGTTSGSGSSTGNLTPTGPGPVTVCFTYYLPGGGTNPCHSCSTFNIIVCP